MNSMPKTRTLWKAMGSSWLGQTSCGSSQMRWNPRRRIRTELQRMEGRRLLWGVLEEETSGKRGEEVRVEEELLKRKIKCHPTFSILKETHLNCLKICSGDEGESGVEQDQLQSSNAKQENHSDLDLFMEAYHAALVELAREIQKPMKEAAAFMELMYCLLDDIASTSRASKGATGSGAE